MSEWVGSYRKLRLESHGISQSWRAGLEEIGLPSRNNYLKYPRRHDEEVAQSGGDIKSICDAVYNNTKPVNQPPLPPGTEET